MFRNPRDNPNIDVGRPPTPPQTTAVATHISSAASTQPYIPISTPARPLKGMQRSTSKRNHAPEKGSRGGNASILSFFKKTGPTPSTEQENDSLFVSDHEGETDTRVERLAMSEKYLVIRKEEDRYNEDLTSSKRRRTDTAEAGIQAFDDSIPGQSGSILREIDVSNSQELKLDSQRRVAQQENGTSQDPPKTIESVAKPSILQAEPYSVPLNLNRESTTLFDDGFEGIEDFVDDEFPEDGEEHIARQWLEEQRLMELDFEEDDDVPESGECEPEPHGKALERPQMPTVTCPICNTSLHGLGDAQVSQHVNGCLDGDISAPSEVAEMAGGTTTEKRQEPQNLPYKRFQRAAIARPAQENPFSLDHAATGGSAFSKIMASHAEDTAWATAAANEAAARGKPAYQRTCPFYKILPGFFICVDAFRYGAVEGCHAYFLSHFHSDHYIGLTASWCHGPIYCSRVTGNLVRQQLRVDPKWVVDLEWDTKIEVPRTQGVQVTMIPANHCPGSSLFLFEKTVGRGPRPKLQRVLHCGDFRACPAHVQHPLLRPEVIDIATGKQKEQRIDVCYLDTTYLTPKYAFPRQEEVIKACADICVSLSKDKLDESDSWEQMKKQRAGSGMARFIQKGVAKDCESQDTGDSGDATHHAKRRGRLLVVVGTYSIGKERICLGVAKALNSKIFAAPGKQRVCSALEDPELSALLTNDPLEAQVHMQMLMEIRAETLADYLASYKPRFSRIVGFRPSGWNYRPPNSRFVESPLIQTVLHSENWKPSYSMAELVPQRGSTREASCFGVPYSEHSSFRELTMFCCALHIDRIIPTVNVGSAKSREKMKGWIEKWAMEKRKNGLYKVPDDAVTW